jgi:universal stress protein E
VLPHRPEREPLSVDRILLVIDEEALATESPEHKALLARALTVARGTGAALELFQVCSEQTFAPSWLSTDTRVRPERSHYLDTAATRLAELAVNLRADTGVQIKHDTRQDNSEAGAIIRKAAEADADLIMKTSHQSIYVVGLLTNTDWELIRRSPAHVWFVTGRADPQNILAAIGNTTDHDEIYGADDYDICDFATWLASKLGATNTMLHAVQTPTPPGAFGQIGPDPMAAAMVIEAQIEQRRDLREEHYNAIQALAAYFQLEPTSIKVMEGRPDDVITDVADAMAIDTIIMGAASLNRLERLLRPVNAEPVLARTDCDVVFVRPHVKPDDLPDASEREISGFPPVDLKQAIFNPGEAFNHSPSRLASEERLSVSMRRRLLSIWEHDLRAEMDEEDEGGPARSSRADRLAAVHQAREALSG